MKSLRKQKKPFSGLVFISVISIILFLFSGCSLLEKLVSTEGEQSETSYESIETGAESEQDTVTEEQEEISDNQDQEETAEENGEETAEETGEEAEENGREASGETDQESNITINAYYVDEQAQFLIGEERNITGRNKAELIVAAFNELLKAPERQNIYNLIPEGTEIISAEFVDNYAFINLSPEFMDNKSVDGLADFLVVNCIAATMTEIPDVIGVIFKVNMESIDLYGDIDLTVPVTRNEGLIKK